MKRMMICEMAKNGECTSGCKHAKRHHEEPGCSHLKCFGKPQCVPVMPEYVRETKEYLPGHWGYKRLGQIFRVTSESKDRYTVDASDVGWARNCTTILKSECEPCEAPRYPIVIEGEPLKSMLWSSEHGLISCGTCGNGNSSICHSLPGGCHDHDKWKPKSMGDVLNKAFDEDRKKETKVKYRQLKPISLEKLWEAQPDKENPEFLREWGSFVGMVIDYDSGNGIQFHIWGSLPVGDFIRGNDSFKQRTPEMLAFAEHHGFIEKEKTKKFTPSEFVIPIPDARHGIQLLNAFKESAFYSCGPTYYKLLDKLTGSGVDVREHTI